MNKKVLALIIAIILVAVVGGIFAVTNLNKNNDTEENTLNGSSENRENVMNEDNIQNEENNANESNNNSTSNNSKVAVIYFSATGNTKQIARYISDETGAELIEIEPKQEYTSSDLNYNNNDCRANKEQNDDNARPEIKNAINVDEYDTIYLGYPIWWGTIPKIILTFLDNYDLSGKTVIPFCTSGGTGISQSERDLKAYSKDINWVSGRGFSSSSSKSTVASWVNGLNY